MLAGGFVVEIDDAGPFAVQDVRGFGAALDALKDEGAPVPRRVVLLGLEAGLHAYLAAWAEDAARVRRTVTIGGKPGRLLFVATLASFGPSIDPALGILSLSPACDDPRAIFVRSGVHRKVDVAAALLELYGDDLDAAPRSWPFGP